YLERFDLAHVDPSEAGGFDALGKGVQEGKPATNYVSKGLTRSRTDRLSVVRGVPPPTAGGNVTAIAAVGGARAEIAGTTALKAEPEAKLSPAEQLEQRIDPQDARAHAKAAASEKRAEARAKGYEGEACGECGNFTLVRNGTCMKCDTCGSTTGCS
ncbi:MAG TPA: vitamin B12-dependent ribonucleotide reductase, partial [Pseudolabrys sp.]